MGLKVLISVATLLSVVLAGGYDTGMGAGVELEKHRGEGWVRGGDNSIGAAPGPQSSPLSAPQGAAPHSGAHVGAEYSERAPTQYYYQHPSEFGADGEDNHEYAYPGNSPLSHRPEVRDPPAQHNGGAAPANYPPLVLERNNEATFDGRGGYSSGFSASQPGPSSPGSAPPPPVAAPQQAPVPSSGYRRFR